MTINNKSERNYRGKCLGSPVTSYGGAFYGEVGCGAIPLCFIFCFISFTVLLVHSFTTLTLMGRIHLFGIAFLHILFFSFPL